jgi:hypothetical protein
MAEKKASKDAGKSKSQKTVEESDGASVDLSEGTSKPYLDEDGGYTEVNRAGPDEPRLDNVKAHGTEPAEGPQILDRDAILQGGVEEARKRRAEVTKNELALSAELEKQRVPRGTVAPDGFTAVSCPNCGAKLVVSPEGAAVHS